MFFDELARVAQLEKPLSKSLPGAGGSGAKSAASAQIGDAVGTKDEAIAPGKPGARSGASHPGGGQRHYQQGAAAQVFSLYAEGHAAAAKGDSHTHEHAAAPHAQEDGGHAGAGKNSVAPSAGGGRTGAADHKDGAEHGAAHDAAGATDRGAAHATSGAADGVAVPGGQDRLPGKDEESSREEKKDGTAHDGSGKGAADSALDDHHGAQHEAAETGAVGGGESGIGLELVEGASGRAGQRGAAGAAGKPAQGGPGSPFWASQAGVPKSASPAATDGILNVFAHYQEGPGATGRTPFSAAKPEHGVRSDSAGGWQFAMHAGTSRGGRATGMERPHAHEYGEPTLHHADAKQAGWGDSPRRSLKAGSKAGAAQADGLRGGPVAADEKQAGSKAGAAQADGLRGKPETKDDKALAAAARAGAGMAISGKLDAKVAAPSGPPGKQGAAPADGLESAGGHAGTSLAAAALGGVAGVKAIGQLSGAVGAPVGAARGGEPAPAAPRRDSAAGGLASTPLGELGVTLAAGAMATATQLLGIKQPAGSTEPASALVRPLHVQHPEPSPMDHVIAPGGGGGGRAAPKHGGSGGAKKQPGQARSAAQQKMAELQKEAAWKKQTLKQQTFHKAQRVGVAAQDKQDAVHSQVAAQAKESLCHAEQEKATVRAQAQEKQGQSKVTLESLKQQLEQTIAKDTADVQATAERAKQELGTRLAAQKQQLQSESQAQILNLQAQQLGEKEQAIKTELENRKAQLKAQADAQEKLLDQQAKAEREKVKVAGREQAQRVKDEALGQSQQTEQKGLADAAQARATAQQEAAQARQAAQAKAAQAKAQEQSEHKGVLGTIKGWFSGDAGAAAIREGERIAGNIITKGELTAKNLEEKAKKAAEQLRHQGEDQAFKLQQAADAQAKQMELLASRTQAKQRADADAAVKRMEADAQQQIAAVKGQIQQSIAEIQRRLQTGLGQIEQELQSGLARIEADAQQRQTQMQQQAQAAQQKLAAGSEKDLKQLEQLVSHTTAQLDHQAAAAHTQMEATVRSAEQHVKQEVKTQLLAMAAEAEKALAMIDGLYDSACQHIAAQAEAAEAQLSADAMMGTVALDKLAAGANQALTDKGDAAVKGLADKAAGATAALDQDLAKARGEMAQMKDGALDPEVEAYKQRQEMAGNVAGELDKAMKGLGTDEAAIFRALRGRSPEEIKAIKESYKQRTGRDLDADLEDEMSGDELREAKAHLGGDKVQAAVAELKNSQGFFSGDADKMKAVLANPELKPADKQRIYEEYENQTGVKLTNMLKDQLGEKDLHDTTELLGNVKDVVPDYSLRPGELPPDMQQMRKDAGELRKAINGLGTDEAAIMKTLRGKSPAQIKAILDEYKVISGGVELRTSLESELSGNDLMEAKALLSADPVRGTVASLRNASEGGGTDEKKIHEALEQIKDPAVRRQVQAEFEKQTGQSLDAMIKDEMTGNDRDLGLALSSGDFDKAAAVRLDEAVNGGWLNSLNDSMADTFGLDRKAGRDQLSEAMGNNPLASGLQYVMGGKVGGTNFSTDHEAIFSELEKIDDPYTRQKVLEAYKARTGVDLQEDLKARLQGAKLDVTDALLQGDTETAAAAKMEVATKGAGTNEESLFKQLEGKKAWEREAIISAYNAKYGEASGTPGGKNFDQMLDSELSGLDLEKARMLAADGRVSPEFAVLYAVDGAGTDEEGLRRTLEGKTTAEIEEIRKAYNAKYGPPHGQSFDERIKGEISGRDAFEVGMMLEGEPDRKDPDYARKMIERAERRYDFERGKDQGAYSSFSSMVMDLTSESGADLDRQHAELERMKAELAKSGGQLDSKQMKQLDAVLERHDITKSNYQATKDAVTNNVAMGVALVASSVAGLVVSVVSGGTATPAVIMAISTLVGGLSSIATKQVLQGNAYGDEDAAIDLTKTLLQAATAGGGKMLGPLLEAKGLSPFIANLLTSAITGTAGSMTDAAFDEKSSRRLEDWFANMAKSGFKGGAISTVTAGIGQKFNLGPSATLSESILKGSANGMISTLISLGIDPSTYEGQWDDILLRVSTELTKSGISGGTDGATDFLTAPHVAGRKAADKVEKQGGDKADQDAAYKQAHDQVLADRLALLKQREEEKKKNEKQSPEKKNEEGSSEQENDEQESSEQKKKQDNEHSSEQQKDENQSSEQQKDEQQSAEQKKDDRKKKRLKPIYRTPTPEETEQRNAPTGKPPTPEELAARQQQRANVERDARITSDQRTKFTEIDELRKLARTEADWNYIRELEHKAGRPLSQRTSANNEQAALDIMADDTNYGVHRDGTPVSQQEHNATIAELQQELAPGLAADRTRHEDNVLARKQQFEKDYQGLDLAVTQDVSTKIAKQPDDESGVRRVAMDGAASLGMGGAGATGGKVAGGKRIGIEDVTRPELWTTLGHKPVGQEAAAISYGKDGITTAHVAEHATAQPARSSELALHVAAQRKASKIGTLGTNGPVGELEFTPQLGTDGKPVAYTVGVPVQVGEQRAVLEFNRGVDITTGTGPARQLLTQDQGPRKAQLTPKHAEELGSKILSGEKALARPASDFAGKEVLGIGGGPTSIWAMEHAASGGAKSVEVAGAAPRPKPDTPQGKQLAEVENRIRALVKSGQPVPAELTESHHRIIGEHVQAQEGRLAEIDRDLAAGGLEAKSQERLQQERERIRADIDPFIGARVDRNDAALNNPKIKQVQADVIDLRPVTETDAQGKSSQRVQVTYGDGTTRVVDQVIPAIGSEPNAPGGINRMLRSMPEEMRLEPVIAGGRVVGLVSNPPGVTISGAAMVGTASTLMPAELLRRIRPELRDAVLSSLVDHAERPEVSDGSRKILQGIENVGDGPALMQEQLKLPLADRNRDTMEWLQAYNRHRQEHFGGAARFDDDVLDPPAPRYYDGAAPAR